MKIQFRKQLIIAAWTLVLCCLTPFIALEVNDQSAQQLSSSIEHNETIHEPNGIFSESFRVVSHLSSSSVVRDLLYGFVEPVPKIDLIYESKILQIIWLAGNHPINLSPTDIIFPFHYFW